MYLDFAHGYVTRDIAHARWRFRMCAHKVWGRIYRKTDRDKGSVPKDHQ